jgi:hypothetical protein
VDLENIFELLKKAKCNPEYIEVDSLSGFSRVIRFEACGTVHSLSWWHNQSYLHVGSRYASDIPFKTVAMDHCWPNYSCGLKFSEGDYNFYIATKMLDWQEAKQGKEGER